jgi:4-methyl-5(b-hydroxyethyl)-thiazole monophosphate biosynthesis
MPRVCVPLAEGCEEIEAVTIIDVLRRAEIEVVTASLGAVDVRGSHGIVLRADTTLEALLDQQPPPHWDAVVLPGGQPGSRHLRDDARVLRLLRGQHQAGGRVAAICAAPIALAAAGLLAGHRATSHPTVAAELAGIRPADAPVVSDRGVITSRGVGTALAFALQLVAELSGSPAAERLRAALLVPAPAAC